MTAKDSYYALPLQMRTQGVNSAPDKVSTREIMMNNIHHANEENHLKNLHGYHLDDQTK